MEYFVLICSLSSEDLKALYKHELSHATCLRGEYFDLDCTDWETEA